MQYRFPATDISGAGRELIIEQRGDAVTLTLSGLPGTRLRFDRQHASDLGILLTSLARFGNVQSGGAVDLLLTAHADDEGVRDA
jgi:hypothetical protein